MRYKIELSRKAGKDYLKLPTKTKNRIAKIFDEVLPVDPFPKESKKLKGYDNIFRIRVGDYRILYTIEKEKLIILIFKIEHRKEIYKK